MKNNIELISISKGKKITWDKNSVFLELLLSAAKSAVLEEKNQKQTGKIQ